MNKEAWKFFYCSVKDHHGFVTTETMAPFLNQLFELISPGVSDVVIANCMHYINKVLQLPERESQKLHESGSTSRGDDDIKSIEKDVKQFSSVLVKHCVRIHLVYKRLQFNKIGGAPFLVCKLLL